MIRNIDRIRKMSLEELAPLLVHSKKVDVGGYDWGGNLNSWYVTRWFSPSGKDFYEQEEAIEDCIKWLDSEWSRNMEGE